MYNVYMVSSEINNKKLYKIGYTKREVSIRVKEFKTGNASDFEIVDVFKSKWGTKIERSLHSHFKKFKINGEWFDLGNEDVEKFRSLCESSHNNFELVNQYNTYVMDKGWPI